LEGSAPPVLLSCRCRGRDRHGGYLPRWQGPGATLTIESAGQRGQVVLTDIPRVEKIQSQLYELVEADHDAHTFDNDDRDAIAEKIARAAAVHDENN
jgi:hypothetical protein